MATLRNKRKLATATRQTQEEHPRNGQSRNTSVPRTNEEYITQVFEEIEGRVTKKLFQEFSGTGSRILCAVSTLEFLLNPRMQTHSGTVPGTFQNTKWKIRERMRMIPRMILILKQASSAARLHKTLAQKLAITETLARHPNKTYYHYFRTKSHSIHLYVHRSIYIKFYIVVHTYVPIRKRIILQDYDNYMLYFVSDVNPY